MESTQLNEQQKRRLARLANSFNLCVESGVLFVHSGEQLQAFNGKKVASVDTEKGEDGTEAKPKWALILPAALPAGERFEHPVPPPAPKPEKEGTEPAKPKSVKKTEAKTEPEVPVTVPSEEVVSPTPSKPDSKK